MLAVFNPVDLILLEDHWTHVALRLPLRLLCGKAPSSRHALLSLGTDIVCPLLLPHTL